jgi:hypothetical protein
LSKKRSVSAVGSVRFTVLWSIRSQRIFLRPIRKKIPEFFLAFSWKKRDHSPSAFNAATARNLIAWKPA